MAAPPPQMQDWYRVLGVARDADQEEIKRVYRQLALELHPGALCLGDVWRLEKLEANGVGHSPSLIRMYPHPPTQPCTGGCW